MRRYERHHHLAEVETVEKHGTQERLHWCRCTQGSPHKTHQNTQSRISCGNERIGMKVISNMLVLAGYACILYVCVTNWIVGRWIFGGATLLDPTAWFCECLMLICAGLISMKAGYILRVTS